MPVFKLIEDDISFPNPVLAEEDGFLAVGGDLSLERLLLAYSNGIFPWYNPGEIIQWWCPKNRFIIYPEKINISRSMKKIIKKGGFKVYFNRDFKAVMSACRQMREKSGTWIGDDMEIAYGRLFDNGFGFSCEVYNLADELVGGLYGVSIGKCFFGESMFSKIENGSKIALICFAKKLEEIGAVFIDCQFHTDHLESMGGEYISWEKYCELLKLGIRKR